MKKLELSLNELNKEVNSEELKKILYSVYAVVVMLMPVIPEILNFGFYSMKWTIYVTMTLITSILLSVIAIQEKKFKFTFLDIILGIYLLLVGLSTIFAKYGIFEAFLGSNGRGEGSLLILCYGLTFVIFSKGYRHINWALKSGIAASLVLSIYSILQVVLPSEYLLPFGFVREGDLAVLIPRVSNVAIGTMLNRNFFSSYICLFLPMITFHYINTGKKTSLCLAIMLFLAQVFTVTLGGYITYIAMYIIVVIYSLIVNRKKSTILIRTLLLTALLVITFTTVNHIKGGVYQAELSGIKTETTNLVEQNDRFGTGRLGIWKKCLMIAANNKWIGVGPDSIKYEITKEDYILKPYDPYRFKIIIDKAHSEPIHIAATTGIPSAVIYLIFVAIICILLLKICITRVRNNELRLQDRNTIYIHMILISITSYLMQSMINISVVQVAPIYWAMLGLGAGIIYSQKENINEIDNK